jgi:hypothetical protein
MPQEPTWHDPIEVVRGFADYVPSRAAGRLRAKPGHWRSYGMRAASSASKPDHDIAEARRAAERLAKEVG